MICKKTKFLGVIFDCKLSFIPHLHYLREKCLKTINLLRVVVLTLLGEQMNKHFCAFTGL